MYAVVREGVRIVLCERAWMCCMSKMCGRGCVNELCEHITRVCECDICEVVRIWCKSESVLCVND